MDFSPPGYMLRYSCTAMLDVGVVTQLVFHAGRLMPVGRMQSVQYAVKSSIRYPLAQMTCHLFMLLQNHEPF